MASEDGDPVDTGQPFPTDSSPPKRLPNERVSTETVRELYEVHSRELLAFLVGVLRDGHAAEEVAQATFGRLAIICARIGEQDLGHLVLRDLAQRPPR